MIHTMETMTVWTKLKLSPSSSSIFIPSVCFFKSDNITLAGTKRIVAHFVPCTIILQKRQDFSRLTGEVLGRSLFSDCSSTLPFGSGVSVCPKLATLLGSVECGSRIMMEAVGSRRQRASSSPNPAHGCAFLARMLLLLSHR